MTGFDSLTGSGRQAPMASITQHFQLVKAEQRLLRSLAVPAVSNALSPARKLQLRAPDDPTFQPSFFGEGLAEVRAGVCVFGGRPPQGGGEQLHARSARARYYGGAAPNQRLVCFSTAMPTRHARRRGINLSLCF